MKEASFRPIGEYPDFEIGLVERGHHLCHVIHAVTFYQDQIRNLPEHHDATDFAEAFSKQYLDAFSFRLQYHQAESTNLQTLLEQYQFLKTKRWFSGLMKALINNSIWSKAQVLRWDEDLEFGFGDIDVHLRYLLADVCHKTNRSFFIRLLEPRRWFDFTSLQALYRDFKTNTDEVDALLVNHPEMKNMSFPEMEMLVSFVLNIATDRNKSWLLASLRVGSANLFVSLLSELQKMHNQQITYFQEIHLYPIDHSKEDEQQNDLMTRHITFFTKVIEATASQNTWVVINNQPGELCKIEGTVTKPKCAQHCLRKRNAQGDEEHLELIEIFRFVHPEWKDKIRLVYNTSGKLVEAAIHSSILLDPAFQQIFN